MPRRRRRGSPKARRRTAAARPAADAGRRHDAAAPSFEPLIDAPLSDRDLRHQPLPARTHAGADAPAAKVQRSVDFLRAPSIDLAAPRRSREALLFACAALLGSGAAAGVAASLQELGWHLRPAAAASLLLIALAIGLGAGCWLPRILLLRRLRRLRLVGERGRIATAPDAAGESEERAADFIGGVVGGVLLAGGLAWLLAGLLVANLERWRAFVTGAWLLPPEVLAGFIAAPPLVATLLAGMATGACLPALVGWHRTLCNAPLRAGLLGGTLLAGALAGVLATRIAGTSFGIVAAPTLLFAAAALLALRRQRGIAPAAPLQAPDALTRAELAAGAPLFVAGCVAAAATIVASSLRPADALAFALAGTAGGVCLAAVARPPRGRRLIAVALLAGALLALWTPGFWQADAWGGVRNVTVAIICALAAGAAALSARSLLSRMRSMQRTLASAAGAACLGCACGAAVCLSLGVGAGRASRPGERPGMSRIEALLRAGGLRVAHVNLGEPATAMLDGGIGHVDLVGRRFDALLVHASAGAFDAWARDRARAARLLRRLDAAMLPGGRVVLLAGDAAEQERLAARVAGLRNPLDWGWFRMRVEDGAEVEYGLLAGRDVPAWSAERGGTSWAITLEPLHASDVVSASSR